MADYFYGEDGGDEIKRGRRIYRDALSDRRGFRPDQIGIPIDDDVWLEIFGAIGDAAASECIR